MQSIQKTINSQGVCHAETGITAEEWAAMLDNGTIAPKQIEVLLCIYREPNHEAICNVLAKKYGRTSQFYNNAVWQAGKRVQQHLARFEIVGAKNNTPNADEQVYWCVPMDGRNTKQGFVYVLKPELCEALEDFLYRQLLSDYVELRKTHQIDEDGVDEKYKWEKVTECYGKKSLVEIADAIKSTNLVYTAYASPCIKWLLENKREEFSAELHKLAEGTAPLNERISEYSKRMKVLNKENEGAKSYFANDERTIATILSCYAPDKYTFYIDKLYQPFCKYLGVESHKAGEKYGHFLQLLQPLAQSVEQKDELQKTIASQTKGCIQSSLLSAQDVCWSMFMAFPQQLTYSQQRIEEDINQNTSDSTDKLHMEKSNKYKKYIDLLEANRNIVLTGAPGTGKTFMAKAIAAEMGAEVGFAQFHPSYDYTDFVEGLRPIHKDGNIGFERKDGVFKAFCKRAQKNVEDTKNSETSLKPFVFIIDEINRGEISKIFGELFFSIDPGYRGVDGRVNTQYQNLVEDGNTFAKGFFVPENVYIIGTMNDIDRSVESMDFAMRRRFAWVEVKADDELSLEMLDRLDCAEEAKARMANLNRAILNVQGLNEAYQIGAAYFKKMELYTSFDQLWENHIKGLLSEYLRGNRNEQAELEKLHEAFNDASTHREDEKEDAEQTEE